MSRPPSAVRTSTHDVFPPNRTVDSPGVGIDPRHPQIFSWSDTSGALRGRLPEERNDSHELRCRREERHARDREASALAVEAGYPELAMGGSPLQEGDA